MHDPPSDIWTLISHGFEPLQCLCVRSLSSFSYCARTSETNHKPEIQQFRGNNFSNTELHLTRSNYDLSDLKRLLITHVTGTTGLYQVSRFLFIKEASQAKNNIFDFGKIYFTFALQFHLSTLASRNGTDFKNTFSKTFHW